jgi:hypothetical protein
MRSIGGGDGVIDVMRCDIRGTSSRRRRRTFAVRAIERRTLRTFPVKEASLRESLNSVRCDLTDRSAGVIDL